MATNLPSVPTIPGNLEPQLMQVLSAIKANVEAFRSTSDSTSGVTQTLIDGIVSQVAELASDAPDKTPPQALDELEVNGGVLYNILTWGRHPANVDHVNIYRAATNDRTVAEIVGTTQYSIYADYIPEGVNAKYYYWVRIVSKAGIEGEWNLINGNVSTAGTSAIPQGIGDQQVSSISATKIVCATLEALSANLGTVTAGKLSSPDNMFQINLTDKYIIIGSGSANPGSISPWYGAQYISISGGSIVNFEWNGAQYVESKSLRVIEVGTAQNGATVQLQKYYRTQPKIIVSPDAIQTYNAAQASKNQTLQVAPTEIKEVTPGSGIWSFKALAQLVSAEGYNVVALNWSIGPSSATDLYSPVYTTPADTKELAVSLRIGSFRGTGTAPNYYYRSVGIVLYTRPAGVGTYIDSAYIALPLGATLADINATITAYFTVARSYDFAIRVTYYDYGGTFTSGSGGYEYIDATCTLPSDTAVFAAYSDSNTPATASPSFQLTSFSPASGYSVYQVDYTINWTGYLDSHTLDRAAYSASASMTGLVYYSVSSGPQSWDNDTLGDSTLTNSQGTIATTTSSWGGSTISGFVTLHAQGSTVTATGYSAGYATSRFKVLASGTKAVIRQRRPISNSATASNSFTLASYTSKLATAATLANGTLNYTAIL
jgi:hypothetical protein